MWTLVLVYRCHRGVQTRRATPMCMRVCVSVRVHVRACKRERERDCKIERQCMVLVSPFSPHCKPSASSAPWTAPSPPPQRPFFFFHLSLEENDINKKKPGNSCVGDSYDCQCFLLRGCGGSRRQPNPNRQGSVHHWGWGATHWGYQSFTPYDNSKCSFNCNPPPPYWSACFQTVGGSHSTWRKATHTFREHVNYRPSVHGGMQSSRAAEQRSSRSEASALTTAPFV